jgi:hypothetical protein
MWNKTFPYVCSSDAFAARYQNILDQTHDERGCERLLSF